MTTNAFLFSWCENGIEAIVPITQYEDFEEKHAFDILKTGKVPKCPLDHIVGSIIMRARANGQRAYEVYTIDCSEELTEEVWKELWENSPQMCADIIREKGVKLYSTRRNVEPVIR
jgi:hypothetical protein